MLRSLLGRIKEESTEERDPHAVTEDGQVGLGELKRCRVLVHHLPHAVQEQHEERGLDRGSTGQDEEGGTWPTSSLTLGNYLLFVVLL